MTNTNLQPINFGHNRFCGPSVIVCLTGISTDEAESLFRQATGRWTITGVQPEEMKAVLKLMDWEMKELPFNGSSLFTLFQSIYSMDGLYIVGIPGHVIAIEVKDKHIFLCDNATKQPIQGAASARLGKKVGQVYKIYPKPLPPQPWIEFIRQFVIIPQQLGL